MVRSVEIITLTCIFSLGPQNYQKNWGGQAYESKVLDLGLGIAKGRRSKKALYISEIVAAKISLVVIFL